MLMNAIKKILNIESPSLMINEPPEVIELNYKTKHLDDYGLHIIEPTHIPTYDELVNNLVSCRACHDLEDDLLKPTSKNITFVGKLIFHSYNNSSMSVLALLRLRTGNVDGVTAKVVSVIPLKDYSFGDVVVIRKECIYHFTDSNNSELSLIQKEIVNVLNRFSSKTSKRVTYDEDYEFLMDDIFCFNLMYSEGFLKLDRTLGDVWKLPDITNQILNKAG